MLKTEKIGGAYCVSNAMGGGMKNRELSAAEVREKHGEVVTYDLGKPQPYEVFSTGPEDIQRDYLKTCYWTHGAGLTDIQNMLGVTSNKVYALFQEYAIPRRKSGAARSAEDRAKWDAFLRGVRRIKDVIPKETADALDKLAIDICNEPTEKEEKQKPLFDEDRGPQLFDADLSGDANFLKEREENKPFAFEKECLIVGTMLHISKIYDASLRQILTRSLGAWISDNSDALVADVERVRKAILRRELNTNGRW